MEAFQQLYLARLEEFSHSIFQPERIAEQVDRIAAAIRPAVKEESESTLARFDALVAGELLASPGPFGGGQTKPIKPFSAVRRESVLAQLAGTLEGLSPGNGFQGGSGGSGLGMFGEPLLKLLDQDQDASVSEAEFVDGLAELCRKWNGGQPGGLDWVEVATGIEHDLPPQQQGFSPFGRRPRRDRGPPRSRPSPGPDTQPGGPRPGMAQ